MRVLVEGVSKRFLSRTDGGLQALGDVSLTVVGILVLSLLGLGRTWGLRALEPHLVPWKEEFR